MILLGVFFLSLIPISLSCFCDWIGSLEIDRDREIIAIDGKILRGSGNRRKNKKALHLVSAWAVNNRLMLGQVKTEERSNEIEAIPRLLNMLYISNSIVTIDAMGCQKSIAQQIIDQKADYVLSLKENQASLYQDIASIFALATVKRIALNLLTQEKTHKNGIACRRKTAGWNNKYLMDVLKMGKTQNPSSLLDLNRSEVSLYQGILVLGVFSLGSKAT